MPNTQAAKKALRQSEARRIVNLGRKRDLRRTIKSFDSHLTSGNLDEAKKELSIVYKALDKAAKVGIIKENKASRLKSRLTHRLYKAENPTAPTTNTPEAPVVSPEIESEAQGES